MCWLKWKHIRQTGNCLLLLMDIAFSCDVLSKRLCLVDFIGFISIPSPANMVWPIYIYVSSSIHYIYTHTHEHTRIEYSEYPHIHRLRLVIAFIVASFIFCWSMNQKKTVLFVIFPGIGQIPGIPILKITGINGCSSPDLFKYGIVVVFFQKQMQLSQHCACMNLKAVPIWCTLW